MNLVGVIYVVWDKFIDRMNALNPDVPFNKKYELNTAE
jgi:hypothetical protein